MTKEELEKATGQELIEQRDYCGVDGYYGDYLDDVNAEMLKRFNRLAELEKDKQYFSDSLDKQIEATLKLQQENEELDCQKNRNKFCYSCANATERCFKNEIGCPCDKYKSYKDENAELKEKVSFLEDNLRVARKDREDLQLDVAKGLKEFVKDYPATAFRYLADEKYVEQLTKAKVALRNVIDYLGQFCSDYPDCVIEAEQFLNEVEK